MFRKLLASLALTALLGTTSYAQTFPDKAITMIVPFAAGGASDIVARLVADEMGQILNQRILIENVAGAGGSTGLARLAASAPDGYTIGIGNAGNSAAGYSIHPGLKFTPESFTAIGIVAKTLPVIAIKNDFPAKTLAEFIAYAKANPKKVTLAHAGVGSSNYLICLLFLQAAKIDVELIGYRGGAPALNDAMGGHVDGVCDAATSVAGSVVGGKVRGLVTASKGRAATMPDVPTAAEAGLPAFTNEGWNALFLPKGTPDAVLKTLNGALQKAVSSAKVSGRLRELHTVPASGEDFDPAAVNRFINVEVGKYRELLAGK